MPYRMKLYEIRRAKGYSQEYMANLLGCHRNTYAKMEENPSSISISNADKISKILKVPINEIIFLDNTLQNVE